MDAQGIIPNLLRKVAISTAQRCGIAEFGIAATLRDFVAVAVYSAKFLLRLNCGAHSGQIYACDRSASN